MITLLSHDFALLILNRYELVEGMNVDAIAEDSINVEAFEKILSPDILPGFDWEVAWESYYTAFDAILLYRRFLSSLYPLSDKEISMSEIVRCFDSTVESCINEWNDGCLYPKEPTYHKILGYLPKWVIDLSNYYGFDIELSISAWWGQNCPVNRAIFSHNDGWYDGIVVADSSEFPPNYIGEALVVNDHGNATLYLISQDEERIIDSVV